jgi:hypothetical protein
LVPNTHPKFAEKARSKKLGKRAEQKDKREKKERKKEKLTEHTIKRKDQLVDQQGAL